MSAVLSPLDVPMAERDVAPVAGPTTVSGAIVRLALSRERLRAAMMPASSKERAHALGDGVSAFANDLVERVKALPGVAIVLDALRSWWAQHPLHTAGNVAAEASRRLAAPIAERNPVALVLGAALFGALLVLTRPWRWMLRPALFAGLVPALVARAIREVPVDSLLGLFASFKPPAPPASARATAPGPTTPEATTASSRASAASTPEAEPMRPSVQAPPATLPTRDTTTMLP